MSMDKQDIELHVVEESAEATDKPEPSSESAGTEPIGGSVSLPEPLPSSGAKLPLTVLTLPAAELDEPTAFDLMFRPAAALGQLLGIFFIVSMIASVVGAHASWLILPLGLKYTVLPLLVILVASIYCATRFQLPLFVELLSGAAFFTCNLFGIWREMPLIAMGDALEARNKYAAAAICYRRSAELVGSVGVISKHTYLLREYTLASVYAGKFRQASEFAEAWIAHANKIALQVNSSAVHKYHAQSLRFAALCYEVMDSPEKAAMLRKVAYETYKSSPPDSEAYCYAILSAGESLVAQQRFAEAKQLLTKFVENARHCPLLLMSPSMHSGYFKLALCQARLGEIDSAWAWFRKGAKHAKNDLSTFSKVDQAIKEAEIWDADGQQQKALDVLALCERRCRIIDGSVLSGQLKKARERFKTSADVTARELQIKAADANSVSPHLDSPQDDPARHDPAQHDPAQPDPSRVDRPQVDPPQHISVSESLPMDGGGTSLSLHQSVANPAVLSTGRIRALRGLFFITVMLALSQHSSALLSFAPLIATILLGVFIFWFDARQLKAANNTIKEGNSCRAEITFSGAATITVQNERDNSEAEYVVCDLPLLNGIKEIMEYRHVEGIIYLDKTGKAKVMQILGYYVVLSDSFWG
jgi:tetratricopeptide (TPR) repeat protein